MAEKNPSLEAVLPKLPELREKFSTKYADNISSGKYDQRDLERFEKEDQYAANFLRTLKTKGDTSKAVDAFHDTCIFRKDLNLWDATIESFPQYMRELNGIYYKGVDKSGYKILYVDVKKNAAKTPDELSTLKRYIGFHFEMHYKDHPEEMCVVLLDMSGAGVTNVNIDITKFIIACLSYYFPAFLAYMVNYEMPFILSATWTVISAFLSKEQKEKILMVKKKDIGKYIPDEHLWEHMK